MSLFDVIACMLETMVPAVLDVIVMAVDSRSCATELSTGADDDDWKCPSAEEMRGLSRGTTESTPLSRDRLEGTTGHFLRVAIPSELRVRPPGAGPRQFSALAPKAGPVWVRLSLCVKWALRLRVRLHAKP